MPALKIYGRRWHMASDMMPIPAICGLFIHTIWLIVFAPLVAHYDVLAPGRACGRPGIQYKATCAGFLAIYAASWVGELALFVVGCRVYGTAVVHVVPPNCWSGSQARSVVHVTQGMAYSTWAFTALLILALFTIFNAYPDHDKQENWERRCVCVSYLCGCTEEVKKENDGKGAALPSIAQWISGLFGSVDLAPSDITAALVLAAAAQRRRRKNRIKKALNPILKAASNAATSDDTSDIDTESMDSRSEAGEDRLEAIAEVDEDRDAATAPKKRQDGQLDASSVGQGVVAMPANYPEEWKQKFAQGYQQTAERLDRISPRRDGISEPKEDANEARADKDTGKALPHADTHQEGGLSAADPDRDGELADLRRKRPKRAAAPPSTQDSVGYSIFDDGVENGLPNSNRRTSDSECSIASPFAQPGAAPRTSLDGAPRVVSLAQIDPEILEDTVDAGPPNLERPSSVGSEYDQVRLGPDGVPVSGFMQAGLNEPSGQLGAPSELSLAHTTYSGKIIDDKGVAIVDADHPILQAAVDNELVGPDSKPTDDMNRAVSLAVPLERQISFKFPTVITPSEQAEDMRHIGEDNTEQVMTAKQAAKAYAGSFAAVDLDELETASHFVKYAVAAYAIVPVTEHPDKSRCARAPASCGMCAKNIITGDTITSDILKLAELEPDELLYWSHDNTALSHLPYMICLDKEQKKVVVALRGTQSIADLVTDAVVHPEPMEDWIPTSYVKEHGKMGPAFGHAGMVLSATAILKDMDDHGVLDTLFHGEEYKDQQHEASGEGVGAKMRKKVKEEGYQLVVTGHSLGAGTAALLGLRLKERFPDVRTWAFNPPGGLVSRNLNRVLDTFCTSLVVGKDAVSRGTVNNLSRLMDEMVTALARCRYHKLHVIMGGWWWKERRPAPDSLFCPYDKIPREARALLERYHMAQERKGRALNMYPPGRIIFLRPIKVAKRKHGEDGKETSRKIVKRWDAVWVSPREVVGEGILVSKRMLEDHLSEKALIPALRFVAENHPQRLAQSETKQMQKAQDARQFQKNVKDTVPANGAATTGEKAAVDAVT